MNTASPPTPAAPASSWEDVAAIYRRICLLRCSGRASDAARLEAAELAPALRQVMPADGETPAYVTFRDGLFALECERVHQAQAVAELLAPLLLDRLGRAPEPAARPKRSAIAPPPTRGPVDIADMIDTLLAQQTELAGR